MSLTHSPANETFSSASRTPAPTQATPESRADDSDIESIVELRTGEHNLELPELRKLRNSSEKRSQHRDEGHEDSFSDDDSEKEHIRPMRRVGSRSKEYSNEEEKVIVRKFDRRLTLFIALLYMLSFLDRSSQTPQSTISTGPAMLTFLSLQTSAMLELPASMSPYRSAHRSIPGFSRPSTSLTSPSSGWRFSTGSCRHTFTYPFASSSGD